ncbi:MAG: c-type cytochrome [Panacagrimonas sp.]
MRSTTGISPCQPERFWRLRTPGIGRTLALGLLMLTLPMATLASKKGGRVKYTEQDGRQIYIERCALCHMPDGRGRTDGTYGFPPLTGMAEWFALREGQLYIAHALIFGPYGGVMVGDRFYNGIMSRFGHRFSNEQMVAVLRYVAEELNTPLPGYVPIGTDIIEEARRRIDHIDAVHAERDQLPSR